MRDLGRAEVRLLRDGERLPITILQLDVRDSASVQAAVRAALDAGPDRRAGHKRGDSPCGRSVEQTDDDEMLQLFDTNVFGVVRMIQPSRPACVSGAGTIASVSSMLAWIPLPFAGLYVATKAAVNGLSEALCLELAPFGVRGMAAGPSPYPTRFQENEIGG